MIHIFLQMATAFADDHAHAAAAAHADPHAIPWSSLFVQGFNFGLLFIILVVLLRKSVKAHFATRASEYKQLVERAEAAREQAERGRAEIAERLSRLEAGAENTANQARAEAEELKSRMISEARELTQRLEQEAKRTAQVELDKAKAELRRELLSKALSTSQDALKKNLGSSEQKKLQNEFVEKIQVVGG